MKPISVIVAVAFVMFMFWNVRRLRMKRTTFGALAFWTIISFAVTMGFLFPGLIDPLPGMFGMGNKLFFVAVSGILLLIVLTFVIYDITKKNELRTTRLIQQVSLLASELDELKRKKSHEDGGNDRGLQ